MIFNLPHKILYFRFITCSMAFFIPIYPGAAQQLDQPGKKNGVKVSGGVGLNNNFYASDGISNRLNPYFYILSGNVTVNAYGIALPFTFSFSNQHLRTSQPFNIYGVSPTYKKWTFHAGYRNLSFSPYTLNGHTFLGGGIEYRGQKVAVSGMSGRLLKAVEYDSTDVSGIPSYARYGGGVKLSYFAGPDEINVIGFYARDGISSIGLVPPELGLRPEENMVWSIGGKKTLFEKLTVQVEGAKSAWTRNQLDEDAPKDGNLISGIYLMPWKRSTVMYDAFKANATYSFKKMNVGMGYEKIEPQYRTLGAYYFNNDLENITLNVSTALLKNKLNLSAAGGVQRDDLENKKASSMNRRIGSLNLTYAPTSRLSMNFAYSNFTSYVNVKPVEEKLLQNSILAGIDTLNFTQIGRTVSGGCNYKLLESDYWSKNIGVNSSYMASNNRQGISEAGNTMVNGSVFYTQLHKPRSLSMGLNANFNQSGYVQGNSYYVGIGAMGGMPALKKKLKISLNLNLNRNYEETTPVGMIYSVANSYTIQLKKKHALSGSVRYSGRAKMGEANIGRYNQSFNEVMGSLGYNYSF